MVEYNLSDLKLPSGEQIERAFRAVREKFIAQGGIRLQQGVHTAIRTSGMTVRTGNVLSWQKVFRSTGYTAVRPEASARGASSPGAITNYLEGGHRIRPPSGRAARYTPRIRVGAVRGFGFYASAQTAAAELAAEYAKQAAEEVAAAIGKG